VATYFSPVRPHYYKEGSKCMKLLLHLAALAACGTVIMAIDARGQDERTRYGTAANRDYAAVFARPENPCSSDDSTQPYVECMGKELTFVEMHIDAFVQDLRGMAGSSSELAALNRADAAWRAYRQALCQIPFARFGQGTVKGPMSVDCQLRIDRAYMTQLSSMYILSQFPK
jgi:uncharacterized protein YecT (DUF1311 family)